MEVTLWYVRVMGVFFSVEQAIISNTIKRNNPAIFDLFGTFTKLVYSINSMH